MKVYDNFSDSPISSKCEPIADGSALAAHAASVAAGGMPVILWTTGWTQEPGIAEARPVAVILSYADFVRLGRG